MTSPKGVRIGSIVATSLVLCSLTGCDGSESLATVAPTAGHRDAGAAERGDATTILQRDAESLHDGANTLIADARSSSSDSSVGKAPSDARAIGHVSDASSGGGGDAGSLTDARATDTGDSAFVCNGQGARFATGSPSHSFGPGQNTGQDLFPTPILGPPKGGGACQGSTDIVSLGNGGSVVVEFAGNAIVDGPGPDFIVFENPFGASCDLSRVFAELGTVAVSDDLVHWFEFPCTASTPPYGACSGWHVVYANADTNGIDPTDPAVAGGDAYDLSDLGVHRVRYVRITDRADLTGTAGVYDLDAVSIVHPACP